MTLAVRLDVMRCVLPAWDFRCFDCGKTPTILFAIRPNREPVYFCDEECGRRAAVKLRAILRGAVRT